MKQLSSTLAKLLAALLVTGCGADAVDDGAASESPALLSGELRVLVHASRASGPKQSGSSFKPLVLASAVAPSVVTLEVAGDLRVLLEPGGLAAKSVMIATEGRSTCVRAWVRNGVAELPIAFGLRLGDDALDPCTGEPSSEQPVEIGSGGTRTWAHAEWRHHPDYGWYYVSYEG